MRGTRGRERYGVPNLVKADKDKVRLDTVLAVNTATVLKDCLGKQVAFILEFPLPALDVCSLCDLDEMTDIIRHPEATWIEVDQCRWGAYSTKPTVLLTYRVDPPDFAHKISTAIRCMGQQSIYSARCNHAERTWNYPRGGRFAHGTRRSEVSSERCH